MLDSAPRTTLSIVHHANQFLMTEGYQGREGLSQVVQGYAGILQLHEQSGVPCGLHLSGTLIEAIAWGCPWFFSLVLRLREQGLIELIGGTYSENIMPLANSDLNRRQIEEFQQIFQFHFGEAEDLKWFWVPERVWDTSKIAEHIQNPQLTNGGYQGVFLDSRLLFPRQGSGADLSRGQVDLLGPWTNRQQLFSERFGALSESQKEKWLQRLNQHSLTDALRIAPISELLRYWIPFAEGDRERLLDLLKVVKLANGGGSLLFADDLERTAGVAGWDSSAFRRYGDFLSWVKDCDELSVALPKILENTVTLEVIDPGSFYEFEAELGGGCDGRGFTRSSVASESSKYLQSAYLAVSSGQSEAQPRILELAWKHLLACHYETLWHDRGVDGPTLAPWSRALASHSRHSLVIAEAARWFGQSTSAPEIQFRDIDQDSEEEIIFKSQSLFAVFSPIHGMRLVALFYRDALEAAMMVGNPTDDWNFQCELNQFMKVPANHPGAFCDEGGEDDRYEPVSTSPAEGPTLQITMINVQHESSWFATRKSISLDEATKTLNVSYQIPRSRKSAKIKETSLSLSPDYLSLLRAGIGPAVVESGEGRFSVAHGKFKVEVKKVGGVLRPAGLVGHGWRVITEVTDDITLEVTCSTL